MSVQRWVFLADPKEYGWNELMADGCVPWDGIGNPQAQKRLRGCAVGDPVLLYHTAPDKALVGVARVGSEPYPDPAYPDNRVVVDLEAVTELRRPLALTELKEDPVLSGMGSVRMPRVAVHPLTDQEWNRVLELSETDPGAAESADPVECGGP